MQAGLLGRAFRRFPLASLLVSVAWVIASVACGAGTAEPATPTSIGPPAVAPEGLSQKVLRSGEPVVYQVCARSGNWLHPSLTDMQDVFTDPAFGDGHRPSPYNYSLYLRKFYWVQYPTAISANKELVAFSGQTKQPPESHASPRCDYQALAAGVAQRGEAFQSLWLVDYHIVAMRRSGDQTVLQVEPATRTFEDVVFPYPPATGFQAPSLLDVVDTSGVQLFEQDAQGDAWQADAAGILMFAWIGGSGSPLAAAIPAGASPQGPGWKLFADSDKTAAGHIKGFDAAGKELLNFAWEQARAAWQALGVVNWQKDLQRLAVEANGADGVLIVRGDVSLP